VFFGKRTPDAFFNKLLGRKGLAEPSPALHFDQDGIDICLVLRRGAPGMDFSERYSEYKNVHKRFIR
jgi:hypothetical protein